MYCSETQIRIKYGECDRMGYVYYGNYALFYEAGRTEMLRSLGLSYLEMENMGILLPVISLNVTYIMPAFYDDLLTLKTYLRELPKVRIRFDYEIFNEKGEKLNCGDTTLVFTNAQTRKPCKAPRYLLDKLEPFFSDLSTRC
jgi:acyl-CoA thioester hydrolase